MSEFVRTQAEFEDLLKRLEGSEYLAIDTEFLREKTYYAKLCLIQINNGSIQAIIDPLSIDDLTPFKEILSDPNCMKIFHAGSQDVDILYNATGVTPAPLFDTQIAASLLGYPLQIGYGPLVKSMCDVKLAKADSYTDWSKRPLTNDQVTYALDDVVYLPEMYMQMRDSLTEQNRLHWLDKEFASMSDPTRYVSEPMEMWRRVKRVSSLARVQLGIAQLLAAWREREAMKRNVPRKWVIPDEAIVEISRKAPATREKLFEVRGLDSRLGRKAIKDILEAVEKAKQTPYDELPRLERKPHGDAEIDGAVDLMAAVVEIRSRQNDVAAPVLASRDDLTKLARGHRSDCRVLEGWRYELVGKELLDLLDGKLALYLNEGAIKVTKRAID